MSKGFVVSLLGLLAAAGLVLGQTPELPRPAAPPGPYLEPPPPEAGRWLGSCWDCMPVFDGPDRPFLTLDAEYLLWFVQAERPENTLTTQAFDGTTDPTGLNLRHRRRRPIPGGRFSLGYWWADYDPALPPRFRLPYAGVEVTGFFLVERSDHVESAADPTLLRPFFDINNRTPAAVLVAAPGLATGNVSADAAFNFWGVEANYWHNVFENSPSTTARVDVMVGFRHLNFASGFRVDRQTLFTPNVAALPAPLQFLAGSQLEEFDAFSTRNHFYGGQVGLNAKLYFVGAIFSADLKLALGTNDQELRIDGGQLRTDPDGTQTTFRGALLALPSNIGRYRRSRFAQVPEANLNIILPLSRHITFVGGYNFLYFNRVIRAADQVDRFIDITQIPNFPTGGALPTGQGRPGVLFRERGLFVHGANIGVEFTW
ncbi:MAG TPA: BBP7 family outer membrane beta-barrel protein [Gemmataceae bacterium]|nr:BBP7 family outer membrane beta-barrel protein [Gemmataceae bacterium]